MDNNQTKQSETLIQVLRKAVYRQGYLIIVAAWLYTISFIFTNYWSYSSTPQRVQKTLQKYIASQEAAVEALLKDSTTLAHLITDSLTKEKNELMNKDFGVFIYKVEDNEPKELYWNTFHMAVNPLDLKRADGNYAVYYSNGLFELIKRNIAYNKEAYIVAALLPLRWNYFIQNDYLQSGFTRFPAIENLYELSRIQQGIPIRNTDGKVLFYLERKASVSSDTPNAFSIVLRIAAMIFFLFFINNVAKEITLHKNFLQGFSFLIIMLFIFRLITYYFPFPVDFTQLYLFNPELYHFNKVNASLGDVVMNVILFYFVVVFVQFYLFNIWKTNWKWKGRSLHIVAAASLVALTIALFEITSLIESLVTQSSISFDVSNFFGLSVYTFLCFLIIALLLLSFYYLSQIFILPAYKAQWPVIWQVFVVVATGLLVLSLSLYHLSVYAKLISIAWLACYLFIISKRSKDYFLPIVQSNIFLFWIVLFSVSSSAILISRKQQADTENQKKIAYRIAEQTDPYGESLLKMAVKNIAGFVDSNFNRFKNPYYNSLLKDSISSIHFSGYLSKYDTKIYTYDSSQIPLYNEDNLPYSAIQVIINNLNNQTSFKDVPGLYYTENNTEGFNYVYHQAIKKDSILNGYFIILVQPKKYKTNTIYPELFKDRNEIESQLSYEVAFAVYTNGRLINHFNNYPFPDTLFSPLANEYTFFTRTNDNYKESWYQTANKTVVVVRKNTTWLDFFTFFAYQFCAFIVVVLLIQFISVILTARFRWKNLKQQFALSLRLQIQSTIILISLISFVVIGIATISFFITQFNNNNKERLRKSIEVLSAQVENMIKNFNKINLLPENFYFTNEQQQSLVRLITAHNLDANLYNAQGNLKITTQPYLYSRQILSKSIHPQAYYQLHYNHLIEFLQNEKAGKLSYLSIYVPIKDKNKTIAYLNIPYFNSEAELNKEISNILVTLINVYALIFVLSGIIALLFTNRITSSFKLIADKMRLINLGGKNEEIEWNKNDEIGMLVNEYNAMVKQLEKSAEALVKTERESAWQQMARQVAHEIKNPLTPMKLSLQYLQKAMQQNAPNVKALSEKVASTLIEQINHLAEIASNFSQFANIGNFHPENFEVANVLQSLIVLYSADASVHIEYIQETNESTEIFYDKTQITRVFTNLIKNAIEAASQQKEAHIVIRLQKINQEIIVSIADNGEGISEEMQQKIFTPNFTTKTSGTGLGLAICKNIIEKAGGSIWFTTQPNKGSVFYVALPVQTAS